MLKIKEMMPMNENINNSINDQPLKEGKLSVEELENINGGTDISDILDNVDIPAFDVLLKRCPKCHGYCPNAAAFAIHWKVAHME